MSSSENQFNKFFPNNFSLETPRVILRPLVPADREVLLPLTKSADTWKYFTRDLTEEHEFDEWLNDAFSEKATFTRMPFLIFDKDAKQVAGSTSFGNISFFDKRIEIGWSWLGPDFIGNGVNKQAKFALLSYAFEVMQMERVEVKTDVLNERAKSALLKVGMIPEGILRSHMQMHSDRRRDTIYFSIIKEEWPERKAHFFTELL
jgi:RimJ/RimL family protein N-acetyltransferase